MKQLSEFHLRCIFGLLLIAISLFCVMKGGLLFFFYVGIFASLAGYEYFKLWQIKPLKPWALSVGLFYLFWVALSLLYIRLVPQQGEYVILWLFILVWSTDTAAYFIGKKIGGKKLAPKISPGKTWSGAIGGAVVATIIASIYTHYQFHLPYHMGLGTNLMLSVIAQGGDLAESALKRHIGVKDSGKLIPGHGGILDRTDALLAVAPFLFLMSLLLDEI